MEEEADRGPSPVASSRRREREEATDGEVLAWARRRGWITFFIFCLILVLFMVIWLTAR